jgi:hypothetical protein
MALRNDIPTLVQRWKDLGATFKHNEELYTIFEGDLLTPLCHEIKAQFSADSAAQVLSRVAPINVLRRVVDKLSKIYAKAPVRKVVGGDKADDDLLAEYEKLLDVNTVLGGADGANGLFNLYKNTWIEPFLDEGKPKLRVIPSSRFFVWSENDANPLRPTHLVKIMGKVKEDGGAERTLFYGYSKDEFVIFDDEEKVRQDLMAKKGNSAGVNPLGRLPGVYINRSRHELMPKVDSDTLQMTKLIPILLSDLNYALKFQCFSTIYTIDCDQTGIKLNPNFIWNLKSDATSGKTPSVGSIKPEVDSDKALTMVRSLLSFWMQTKNIKPGAIGELTVENAVSGIAKALDEMDTSEDRQAQIPYFMTGERDLWDLIKVCSEKQWSLDPLFELRGRNFSAKATVEATFAEQRPILDSGQAIDEQKKKIDLRIQTRAGALKELYPDWTDEQIAKRLAEVDTESADNMARAQAMGLNPDGTPQKPDATQSGTDPNGDKTGDQPAPKGVAA